MPLSRFHPLVQSWFQERFQAPTDAQAQGWPAIAQGRHTLIAAPTGSGKTLAAFLTCLDGLVREGLNGGLPDRTEVVYVSPLKALSNDIERNLSAPLSEIRARAESAGTPLPEIRVGVRTGDTPASERQRMAKRPPHVLITTPESLYILLTSESGRKALRSTRTLILDELHAVAPNKRGAHLSLSVERLCALADGPITRIGLSATQRPIDEVARFLVGSDAISDDGEADCVVVDTGHARAMDLALELTEDELGPIATHEQWDRVLDRIADLVKSHDTTLLFVNTRRLVERLAHQLSGRLGEESVVAHHGSLSQERRHDAEERLKHGRVKVCVATSSLELGIDVGFIDLVCQVGSPRSIGLLIQRVGRSGHFLGGMPKGRLFPLTRDELIECLGLIRGYRLGNLDSLSIPPWPLDVLAQQSVAECASREWDEDALFELWRGAYPYRALPREKYDSVLETLSRGVAPRDGRRTAYLHRDGVNHRLRGRRGARLAALTNAGAIPDNADYDVIAEPDNTFVGSVNEDFAIESMRGDVFLLGNTPWKIRRVERSAVRVEDARGQAPTIPFWLGEAPGRTTELSNEVTAVRDGLHQRIESGDGPQWLMDELGVSRDAAEQAAAYVAEGVRILGTVPTKKRIVAERFFDESGGMQLVIHSPLGSMINRAWGMALRKEICRTFDFELQAAATEDGINLSLGPSLSFALEETFRYVPPAKVEKVLTQAVLQAPLFGIRWRWDASRSLALLRFSGGRKVPLPIQRMRSDDLLASVFPAQVMCQDNSPPGDVEVPDHPLVFETMRDCLNEAMDVDGLRAVLEEIERGEIEVLARDTTQPSVFSHQILNAAPYAFLDDAPLEERRSRAVALRRALPEDERDLGSLDAVALDNAAQGAWPLVRDADELHDALLTLGILPQQDLGKGSPEDEQPRWEKWLQDLIDAGRAVRAHYREERIGEDRVALVATESVPLVSSALPDARFEPTPLVITAGAEPPSQDDAELALVRGRVECIGPFTSEDLAQALGMRHASVKTALANMESTGNILSGHFTPGREQLEFCDRRILARAHRDTVARLRQEIEPVSAAHYMRFLLSWQHISEGARLRDEGGLLDVVEQLQGFEAAAAAWELDILPARVANYGISGPSGLDQLCLSGEVVWGRFTRRPLNGDHSNPNRAGLSRTIPVSLAPRQSLPWILDEPDLGVDFPGAAGEVLRYLQQRGASFLPDIASAIRRLPTEVENVLWQLAAVGLVSTDGFAPLRGHLDGSKKRARSSSRRRPRRRTPSSRWSLLGTAESWPLDNRSNGDDSVSEGTNGSAAHASGTSTGSGRTEGNGHAGVRATDDHANEARAMQLLQRYGIVFPEVLAREPMAPRWRHLVRLYRRAEARGEIRGGRFVTGFVGEQFALPEAVEMVRSLRRTPPEQRLVTISACDPLNVAGILTPGPRVPAVLGNRLVLRDGVPIASLEAGETRLLTDLDDETRSSALALLGHRHGAPALSSSLS